MTLVKILTAGFLVLVPLLLTAGDGPKVDFQKDSHDFGVVLYGDTATFEFRFTNSGNQTLVIDKIRTSCGCTKADAQTRELAPGQTGSIVATFESDGLKPGAKKKTIYVQSNDQSRPIAQLTLLAHVKREVTINPPFLAHKSPSLSESLSFPLKISTSSDRPVKVTGLEVKGEGVSASLQPRTVVVEPRSEAQFNIVINLKKEPGRQIYAGNVVLKTDHLREKEIPLQYFIQAEKSG